MNNFILEVGNLDGLVVFLFLLLLAPPIVLTLIGAAVYKKYKKAAKVLFILAGIYLVVGLGLCGGLLIN